MSIYGFQLNNKAIIKGERTNKTQWVYILLIQADEQPLRTSENASVLLTSFTDSWCVYKWKQFLDMVDEELIEQMLIPLLYDEKYHHSAITEL